MSTRWVPMRLFSSPEVPLAVTSPPSISTMRSARASASSRYWVVSRTVISSATKARTAAQTACRLRGSSPVVGSSRTSSRGRATRLAARSTRRRWPPDRDLTTWPQNGPRSRRSASWPPLRRAAAGPKPRSRAISSRFSCAVRLSSRAANCPVRLVTSRTASGWVLMSRPKTVAVPEVGRARVVSIRTIVVLPAPFGPSSDSTMPDATVRSKRSTTVRSAYFLVSCCAQMAMSGMRGLALSVCGRLRAWPAACCRGGAGRHRRCRPGPGAAPR